MSTFEVDPEALLSYGQGSKELAAKFRRLSQLLEQARVDDQCFGLIGGVTYGRIYFNALDAVKATSEQAKTFLEDVDGKLTDVHGSYTGTDQGVAGALKKMGGPA
ncbi:hypothetical protein Afil01_67670 [Actinorhabdospora filicis]|uniref:Excreted virulence factor EspC (Type VII ESX diderm) n=1 Tax=Actinorhabdospora filicis TaxID=1785913 RepID=A0A9W6SU32_9ACTN|nr:hypothetical protein [Actinorhabdospora filicis]GLZ81960.1 hypothetical protein Afil01_67670 [Actinorhabdospora filicis]